MPVTRQLPPRPKVAMSRLGRYQTQVHHIHALYCLPFLPSVIGEINPAGFMNIRLQLSCLWITCHYMKALLLRNFWSSSPTFNAPGGAGWPAAVLQREARKWIWSAKAPCAYPGPGERSSAPRPVPQAPPHLGLPARPKSLKSSWEAHCLRTSLSTPGRF